MQERVEKPDREHEKRRHHDAEINAVDERAMAVLALARAKGLRNERVESDEQAVAEKGQHVEQVGADADGTDGAGAVRKMADHHGVHDAHAHPADFGKNQRQSEPDGGTKFVTKCLEADHVRAMSQESVSGVGTRSK